jgi:putative hemolysin
VTLVIVILALCIVFEALFSGSEIALVSADKVKLRHHAEAAGRRRGKVILDFLEQPGELISTSLVGTNVCVVLSTVVATLTLLEWFPQRAEVLSLAVMTPLVLVFGEILPKSIFQHWADQLAPKVIYALWFFRALVYPVVAVGSAFSGLLLRIFGLDRQQSVMTREELGLLLKLPSVKGEDRITAEEKKMVTRIFEFKDTTVEDVMLPLSEVTALPVSASMEDVALEIADKRHTRLPIYEERLDQIVGIIHAFEVLRASGGESLSDLSRPAIFVPESQPAVDTLVRLQREGQGMAVVVDEYGGATGVITIEDILEEIVGEIEDEYDEAEAQLIKRQPDGSFCIEARAPVERINDELKLHLPLDDDYESLAGLILDHVKRIPSAGEEIIIGRVTLTVMRATERSVDEVRLRIGRKR